MQILVIDVGGTNVKVLATGRKDPVKIPSGPAMTARAMVAAVRKATAGWKYTGVSIGYPGPVIDKREGPSFSLWGVCVRSRPSGQPDVCNLFKRRELSVEFCHCPLQHLAVTGVAGSLQLLSEMLAGKKQAVAFAVALLLGGRDWGASRFSLLRHFLLLLLYGLTFPAACHLGNLTSKFAGDAEKQLACDLRTEYEYLSGVHTPGNRRRRT